MKFGRRTYSCLLLTPTLFLLSVPIAKGQPEPIRQMLQAASRNPQAWAETLAQDKPEPPAKISRSLREAASVYESRGSKALEPVARQLDLPFEGESLLVKLTAIDEESLGRLRNQIRAEGGEIMSEFHGTIFAKLPPRGVRPLGESQWLVEMSPQVALHARSAPLVASDPKAGTLLSATLVDQLQAKGFTGKGATVGILEPGSASDAQHGATVSAVIKIIAPDSLRITEYYDTDGQFIAAVDRLVAQGVQIINHSAVSFDEPRNGAGLLDRKINEVTSQHNVLWVNAAGNRARTHWSVTRNRYLGGAWNLDDNLLNSPALIFRPKKNKVGFTVTWNDWGNDPAHPSPSELLLPFLYHAGDWRPAKFGAWRKPAPHVWLGSDVLAGDLYILFLYTSTWLKPARIHVDWDSDEYPIDSPKPYCPLTSTCHPFAEDSVPSPGSAESSLAVGAIDLAKATPASGNYGCVAPYSSQGPTDEPRPKPDVSAYSGVKSDLLSDVFDGTSASSPFVAGFAALLKQMLPNWTAASARAWILACADRQPNGKSGPNISGRGIVTASRLLAELNHKSSNLLLSSLPDSSESIDRTGATSTLLDRLRESASDPQPFEVRVALGRSSYSIGDGLKLGYRSSESAYFAIFHFDGAGRYVLVVSGGAETRLEPGRGYLFPSAAEGQIKITGPPGEEEFLLVCSKAPIQWDPLPRALPETLQMSVAIVRYAIRE